MEIKSNERELNFSLKRLNYNSFEWNSVIMKISNPWIELLLIRFIVSQTHNSGEMKNKRTFHLYSSNNLYLKSSQNSNIINK